MDIVQEVRAFVENECKKQSSRYGPEPFLFHFVPVVEHSKRLADKLGGDKEIILIAAWLHDIGSIVHGREDHHITGAEIAGRLLEGLGYPEEKTERVKNCIMNHRGSRQRTRESIEERIIAEADAMSNFDNIAGIFKAAFIYENKNQGEAKVSAREKLERKWRQLHFEESREMIRPKFEAAMLLLK